MNKLLENWTTNFPMRSLHTFRCPCLTAQYRGVSPIWMDGGFFSCIFSINNLHTSKFPYLAARWRGVSWSFFVLQFWRSRFSIKSLQTCKWPFDAAMWIGDLPIKSVIFLSTEILFTMYWQTSKCPSWAAKWRAVAGLIGYTLLVLWKMCWKILKFPCWAAICRGAHCHVVLTPLVSDSEWQKTWA